MFKDEITIDDVIEFIIKNCDNTELMDKINKTSFPFTTKYLRSNDWGKKGSSITLTPSIPPYGGSITYCSDSEAK